MPAPDPQPPKPRAVSPARWLLLLLPSALVLSTPLLANMFKASTAGFLCLMIYPIWISAFVLCFRFGFILERWRWGTAKDAGNPIAYGFLILFVNAVVSFAGCSTVFHL